MLQQIARDNGSRAQGIHLSNSRIKQHSFSHQHCKNGKGQKLGWKMLVPMCSWSLGESKNFPMATRPWLEVLVRCRTIYWEFLSTLSFVCS